MNNLLTIPVFWQKVKVARKQLKMPQREVAEAVGVKQGQVSKMESGNQKHVQIALIKLMLKYGVNLNAMFDDSIDAGKFSEIIRHRGKAAELLVKVEDCPRCEEKDKLIESLRYSISLLERMSGGAREITFDMPKIHETGR